MRSFAIRCCATFAAVMVISSICAGFSYQIDDGTTELLYSPFEGGAMAWMNSFQVQPGAETLVSITITTGGIVLDPTTVHIWTDPTNDGNPVDAVGARSAPSSTGLGTAIVPISPLTLSVGDWFFAGGFYARPAVSPITGTVAAVDTTDPDFPNRSYRASWENSASADPDHPAMGASLFVPEPDGNYLVRVNAVPEPAGLFLVLVGVIGLRARRSMR